ncbi:MAG: class I SAM-dependent methyltransferase [Phycisphaerae bacterium]
MKTSSLHSTNNRVSQPSNELEVALPATDETLEQDAEWCVANIDGRWRRIRFHDYPALYNVPGLYEKVIYEILGCNSPRIVRQLLKVAMEDAKESPMSLRALDLGAGNGMMGEELRDLDAEFVVGADIIEEAKMAAERDRPGVYDDYLVCDITKPSAAQQAMIDGSRFNCLTCVAALGFGDIPSEAFIAAFRPVQNGGWIAFNIKAEFLDAAHPAGFAELVQLLVSSRTLEIVSQKRYPHRRGVDGTPIEYVAIVGRKRGEIEE